MKMMLELIEEEGNLDPEANLARDACYWKKVKGNRARVWRNDHCVVLGRFLKPEEEVHLDRAEELSVPVLKRSSGGGAVYQDKGNLNYSLYLDEYEFSFPSIRDSLMALSFPATSLLEYLGVPWEWVPPNNVYVEGRKISGSAQARSRGRLLHHGTLLVSCDLEVMGTLLKSSGRSRMAPVVNLNEVMPGIDVRRVEEILTRVIEQTVAI
jgi:lipoate---protein ligase